jgi:hypothetical protein
MMEHRSIPHPPVEMAPAAATYLQEALTILPSHSLHRATIDWLTLFAATWSFAQGAQEPRDVYPAIEFALRQLNDGHSFFRPPQTVQAIESGAEDKRNRPPTGCNQGFELSDGAEIALTVSIHADRTGQCYGTAIMPDMLVTGEREAICAAASAWLQVMLKS